MGSLTRADGYERNFPICGGWLRAQFFKGGRGFRGPKSFRIPLFLKKNIVTRAISKCLGMVMGAILSAPRDHRAFQMVMDEILNCVAGDHRAFQMVLGAI